MDIETVANRAKSNHTGEISWNRNDRERVKIKRGRHARTSRLAIMERVPLVRISVIICHGNTGPRCRWGRKSCDKNVLAWWFIGLEGRTSTGNARKRKRGKIWRPSRERHQLFPRANKLKYVLAPFACLDDYNGQAGHMLLFA